MELSEKEFLLHRIFSGTTRTEVGNGFYVITSPNRGDRYKAQEVYKIITIIAKTIAMFSGKI